MTCGFAQVLIAEGCGVIKNVKAVTVVTITLAFIALFLFAAMIIDLILTNGHGIVTPGIFILLACFMMWGLVGQIYFSVREMFSKDEALYDVRKFISYISTIRIPTYYKGRIIIACTLSIILFTVGVVCLCLSFPSSLTLLMQKFNIFYRLVIIISFVVFVTCLVILLKYYRTSDKKHIFKDYVLPLNLLAQALFLNVAFIAFLVT